MIGASVYKPGGWETGWDEEGVDRMRYSVAFTVLPGLFEIIRYSLNHSDSNRSEADI